MSMTVEEAIEKIKKDICHGNPKGLCRDSCMYGKGECAYDMATRALEEVQRYRAIIGLTPEDLKSLEKDEIQTIGDVLKAFAEWSRYKEIGTVEELQESVKEEDVLKFYYIESEDKYIVGQRTDTRYYGEIGKTGITFYMSRYLPWGEHIVAPETAWKEHTYPSEPKEIPFFDWLQGFMKKEYGGTVSEFRELKGKATAKKPIYSDFDENENEEIIPYKAVCPACGYEFEFGTWNDEQNHHCECGQRMLWD